MKLWSPQFVTRMESLEETACSTGTVQSWIYTGTIIISIISYLPSYQVLIWLLVMSPPATPPMWGRIQAPPIMAHWGTIVSTIQPWTKAITLSVLHSFEMITSQKVFFLNWLLIKNQIKSIKSKSEKIHIQKIRSLGVTYGVFWGSAN